MRELDIVLKDRDAILTNNIHILKARPWFSRWTYGSESCTSIKAEQRKVTAFELWGWRKLLTTLCITKRTNHLILDEVKSECSLEILQPNLDVHSLSNWSRGSRLRKIECHRKKTNRRQGGWKLLQMT